MSTTMKIILSPEAQRTVASLQTMPQRMAATIAKAMDLENQSTLQNIVENHLTGKGPYPIEDHKLGERSHQLRNSARATAATIEGNTIDSALGSPLVYAGPNEFGARITMPARQQKVRLRVDARGALVRQLGKSNLAMFARSSHKRVKESTVHVGAHEINLPERAPFRTGITERLPNYGQRISAAIIDAMKN
jgi:hypothetical protein